MKHVYRIVLTARDKSDIRSKSRITARTEILYNKNSDKSIRQWIKFMKKGKIDCSYVNKKSVECLWNSSFKYNMIEVFQFISQTFRYNFDIIIHPIIKFWCICSDNPPLFDSLASGTLIKNVYGQYMTIDIICCYFVGHRMYDLNIPERVFLAHCSVVETNYTICQGLRNDFIKYRSKFDEELNPADIYMFVVDKLDRLKKWSTNYNYNEVPYENYLKTFRIGMKVSKFPYALNPTLICLVNTYFTIMNSNLLDIHKSNQDVFNYNSL